MIIISYWHLTQLCNEWEHNSEIKYSMENVQHILEVCNRNNLYVMFSPVHPMDEKAIAYISSDKMRQK